MQQVVAADATLEQLAEGFRWAEGPVAEPGSGDILFSDVPQNTVYRWNKAQGLTVYLQPSGYSGLYPQNNLQEGANGLIFNAGNKLVLAQHGEVWIIQFGGSIVRGVMCEFRYTAGQFWGTPACTPGLDKLARTGRGLRKTFRFRSSIHIGDAVQGATCGATAPYESARPPVSY